VHGVNRERRQDIFIRFDDQRPLHRYASKIRALRSIDAGTTTTLDLSSGSRLQRGTEAPRVPRCDRVLTRATPTDRPNDHGRRGLGTVRRKS
jgi:hypothetical protein